MFTKSELVFHKRMYEPASAVSCRRTMPDLPAEITMHLIERWGMVAAMPDGEDSAGRAKVRLATPKEVVGRAAAVVEEAFDLFAERGWLLDIPTQEEVERLADEAHKKERNSN